MQRDARTFAILAMALATWSGCSSKPAGEASKKAQPALDKVQGRIQLLPKSGGGADAALTGGENYAYLWDGTKRYRLFLRTDAADLEQGGEYVAEGLLAQKIIDELGDPDDGRNGYPLASSCRRAVTMAWRDLPFDGVEPQTEILRFAVKRYPARPVLMVARIRQATPEEKSAAAEKKKNAVGEGDTPVVSVPADKQKALLIEGPVTQPAPLWERNGGTVRCKVVINAAGKISDLESGTQLCEAVPWSQFRYKPPVQAGHAVQVKTEVEVRFEPRK